MITRQCDWHHPSIGPDPDNRCRRWLKDKEDVEVDRPPHCQGIQHHGSRLGRRLQLCRIEIHSRRWYLLILYYLSDLSLVNDWLLYRCHLSQKWEKKYIPPHDLRVQVADALIKVGKRTDLNSRKRGRRSLKTVPEPHQAASPSPPLQRVIAQSVSLFG